MKPPFRIAVLECDTPLPKTRNKFGGYGGVFKALLHAGADGLGMPDVVSSTKGLDITTWDVVNVEQYPKLDDVDAVLLTGSSMSHLRLNRLEKTWLTKFQSTILSTMTHGS